MEAVVTRFLGFLKGDANVESRSEEMGDTSFADTSSSPNLTGDMSSQRSGFPNDGLPDESLTDGNEGDTPDIASDDVSEETNEQDAAEEEANAEAQSNENSLQVDEEESLDETLEESLESDELEADEDYTEGDESSDDDGLAEEGEDSNEDVLDENIYTVHDWETSYETHYEEELGQSVDVDNIDFYDVQNDRAYEEDETYVSVAEDQEDQDRWDDLPLVDLAQDVVEAFGEYIQSAYMENVLEIHGDHLPEEALTTDKGFIFIIHEVPEDISDLIA